MLTEVKNSRNEPSSSIPSPRISSSVSDMPKWKGEQGLFDHISVNKPPTAAPTHMTLVLYTAWKTKHLILMAMPHFHLYSALPHFKMCRSVYFPVLAVMFVI